MGFPPRSLEGKSADWRKNLSKQVPRSISKVGESKVVPPFGKLRVNFPEAKSPC